MCSKVKSISQLWGNRHLSLMGKKLVINTLMGSLFPYILSVLPLLNQENIDTFENYISVFLWNSKKPKISLNVLKSSRESGGMKLFDLKKKDYSLKIQWINRLALNDFTKELFLPLCTNLQGIGRKSV